MARIKPARRPYLGATSLNRHKPPATLMDDIEKRIQRTVDIEVDEDVALHKSNPQEQSPLFAVLPRELRHLIWEFALAPYEAPAGASSPDEYSYRPGHTARLKTDTAVLTTCRRAWLEANALPMSLAEHSYDSCEPKLDATGFYWMPQLTQHNSRNLGHLHMSAHMVMIESLSSDANSLRQLFIRAPFTPGDFQPRKFHLSIRHSDWWGWRGKAPLAPEEDWVQALLDSPDLRSTETLKFELEICDHKVDRLLPTIERLKALVSEAKPTHIINGKKAKTQFILENAVQTYNRTRLANIDDAHYTRYHKLHVIILTWKLRFLEYPSAFIPRARKAPRLPSTLPLGMDFDALQGPTDPVAAKYARATEKYPTIYTAVLPHEPGHLRVSWRKRRRGSGQSPASEMIWRRLRDAEIQVREGSKALEVWCEEERGRAFEEAVAKCRVESYRERWEREGSLLKVRKELVGKGERWWGERPWVTV